MEQEEGSIIGKEGSIIGKEDSMTEIGKEGSMTLKIIQNV
jgi:hypothetical protein